MTAALRMRVARAVASLAYLALSLPLGLISLVVALVVAASAVASRIGLGGPAVGMAAWAAERERSLANRLLSGHIPALPQAPNYRQLLRIVTLLAVKPFAALAALALAAGMLLVTIGLLALGAGIGSAEYVGPVRVGGLGGVLLWLLAVPMGVLTVALIGAAGSLLRTLVRSLLLAAPGPGAEPVRELLAESLGDRTLSIAYWLPDRGIFVDDAGLPVALPDPGSGRAWTAVERDGRRVAAILHDAELDAGPELVQAAAAAAALALDNERLKADLRARVEELRVSRVRIVEAADAARRRLERDLHDGAQQHLVSLALDLRVLKARLRDDPAAAAQVDKIADKLTTALAELRELARGIHPAVLTERGLVPALEALSQRLPIPLDTSVEVGEARLPPPVEAAVYFVISEALTNVVRYARATRARVSVRREAGDVVVDVRDDGVGGADLASGSGLRGLADRISALDGTLRVHSPPGEGTLVQARIPGGAGELVAEAHEPEPPGQSDVPPQAVLEAPR